MAPSPSAALALMPDIAGEALDQPDGAAQPGSVWTGSICPFTLPGDLSVLATADAYVDLTDPSGQGHSHVAPVPHAA